MVKCCITSCDKSGRRIGRLASQELYYCDRHMKYGERVLNFFINSQLHYKLNKYMKEARDDFFTNNIPKLSQESQLAIKEYLDKGIERIDEIREMGDMLGDDPDFDIPKI